MAGDLYYSNVSLLVHFNGTNGQTTFTDNSGYEHTLTASGAVVNTAKALFGTGAGEFHYGTPSSIKAPAHSAFELGTGNFTLEFSYEWDGDDSLYAFGYYHPAAQGGFFGSVRHSDGRVRMQANSGGDGSAETWIIQNYIPGFTANTRYRIRFVRDGDNLYLYIDGTKLDTVAAPSAGFLIGGPLGVSGGTYPFFWIGQKDGTFSDGSSGWFDEFRLTKGIARSTGSTYTLDAAQFADNDGSVTVDSVDGLSLYDEGGMFSLGDTNADGLTLAEALTHEHQADLPGDGLRLVDQLDVAAGTSADDLEDALGFAEETEHLITANGTDALTLAETTTVSVDADGADGLTFTEADGSAGSYSIDTADGLALVEELDKTLSFDLTDGLTFADASASAATLTVDVQDGLTLAESDSSYNDTGAGEAPGQSTIDDLVDHLSFADATTSTSVQTSDVVDTLVLADELLYDALCAAWVMNASTSAMSRYTRLPFNSVAEIDGRVFALGPAGIYELGADDDDGEIIEATAKGGKMLGASGAKSHLGDIAVLMQSAQPVAVTVHSFDKRAGAYTYRTEGEHKATEPTTRRATPGKGLSSVFYQFELANVSGARARIFSATVPALTAPASNRKAY